MKLIGSPRRPFARKVRIVPAEKNIPFELLVARGSTPDSPVIAEYLDGIGSGAEADSRRL
jgi:hypothetical protein